MLKMGYCGTMLDSIKIYTSDVYWNHILKDLGADVVDSPKFADVMFDDLGIGAPVSVAELRNIVLSINDNNEIIQQIFGENAVLSQLQRKIVVLLYKNPDMNMAELKDALGVLPDVATHAVENAIYQLRKKYGHDFIINNNGKYKIGQI